MGDNGEQTRSPVDANSGQKGMDAHPVDFDKGNSGEQGRPAPKAKDVDGASSFQNQPGKNCKDIVPLLSQSQHRLQVQTLNL